VVTTIEQVNKLKLYSGPLPLIFEKMKFWSNLLVFVTLTSTTAFQSLNWHGNCLRKSTSDASCSVRFVSSATKSAFENVLNNGFRKVNLGISMQVGRSSSSDKSGRAKIIRFQAGDMEILRQVPKRMLYAMTG
jgi:hypothetical protein